MRELLLIIFTRKHSTSNEKITVNEQTLKKRFRKKFNSFRLNGLDLSYSCCVIYRIILCVTQKTMKHQDQTI